MRVPPKSGLFFSLRRTQSKTAHAYPQFKLQCTLQGALAQYTTPELNFTPTTTPSLPLVGCTPNNMMYEVDGLYMKVYAFKQSSEQRSEENKVPIHQVGPSRTKKENRPPEIAAIRNGVYCCVS